jgi:hypothetical protein
MKNKMYKIMFALALSMFSANADVITGVAATATTESLYRTASNLVDGSGLTGNQHGTYANTWMWLSSNTVPQSVVFDLGALYNVSQLKVWNYNEAGFWEGGDLVNLGANAVSVTYGTTLSGSTLGGATGTVPSITSFAKASGLGDYTGETFSAPFQARYVKVEITSSYGHPINLVGLSEVQFSGTVAPPVPALITGVTATATTDTASRTATNLVNGSGLSGGTHWISPWDMWLSGGSVPQSVVFDLGAVYNVTQLNVWNYNESAPWNNIGAKNVSVTYGTTVSGLTLGGSTGTVGAITTFAQATGLANDTGEAFSTSFNARYVKFDISSNYGYAWATGLSEVQFIGLAAQEPNASYGSWAGLNAGNGNPDEDFDKDGMSNGVEYFMGQTGSSFTPNPSIVGGKVTWPKDPTALATYVVQTSINLTDWVPAPSGVVDNGTSVEYTVPTGDSKRFTRLKVTVLP